jgi:RNA polymerase sigma factor (sigma-70 family)
MKKYNNWGIDMGGLSVADPERYRKVNYVLNDKGVHIDLLDVVETVSLDRVYDLADEGKSPEEDAILSELKKKATHVLSSLKAREERILRMRFGIGVKSHTLEEIGNVFSIKREPIRQIEAKALRKLKHPSRSRKLKSFLDY